MKRIKNSVLLITITLAFSVFLGGCGVLKSENNLKTINGVYAANEQTDKAAEDVFLKAWDTVKEQYLDKTYNHQDWAKWKHRYIGKIKTKQDAYVAIETMLESLNDPYTRFLKPSDFDEQNMSINAKLYGIGVYIAVKNGKIIVVNVIDDTPAKKSGVKEGDVILKVNQTSTKGLDVSEVAKLVRGRAGTKVTLDIMRGKTRIIKPVLREEISIKNVSYKMLDGKYAYIKLSSFISQEASGEMAEALAKTSVAKGIILDLRGNNGGLLPNAIMIANMFIDNGKIVSIVDRDGYNENINARPIGVSTTKPVVVLINQGSASASEILSGALKDHKRALLIGEKTFGKGCVQRIQDLPDGSGINITIAKYLTPNGSDIHKKGIKPDIQVGMTEQDFMKDRDPQLDKAKLTLAKELKEHNSVALEHKTH